MAQVIYEKTFYQDKKEAWAVIVDHSDPRHLEFRYGIIECMNGGPGIVTYQGKLADECIGSPPVIRQLLWRSLFQQARDEINREIRVAADPHHDLPEREIY